MLDRDTDRVVVEVVHRVLDECSRSPRGLEHAVFDTIYEERRRLETDRSREGAELTDFYDRAHAAALHADPTQHRLILKEIVERFAFEVAGHFNTHVYAVATRMIPPGLSLLLNALSPMRLVQTIPRGFSDLGDWLDLGGEVEQVQRLARRGTLVMTPTHLSHLDSIVMGYAIYRMGLPPHLYGAGLNLFSHKILGFFMHNLGAYKVDRRKKADAYKKVLKTYAGCTMELGYHNLFFPGGTRSRSGSVERRLKMGLLGMGLDAYIHNLIAKKENPDVFVVPCTINYELVLEAETLIEDYLKEAGKSPYNNEDDEFSRPKLVLDFIKKLLSLNSRIHVVFGTPLDVFGNRVDDAGVSRDDRGRPIDRARYVMRDDRPGFDPQRDEQYTRELASAIVDSLHRATVVKTTHLLCHTIFQWLQADAPNQDLYRVLRTGGPTESLPMSRAYELVEHTLQNVRQAHAQNRLVLDPTLAKNDLQTIVGQALAHLASYHRRPALQRRGDRLFHIDRNLLYYYQNRLSGHDLGAVPRQETS